MPCELRSQPYRYCTVSSSLFTTYIHIYKKIAQVENWVLQSHCPSTWQQGMKRRRHWIARGQFKTRPQEKYTYVEATQILVLKTKIDMKHHREIYKDSSFLKVALHARSNPRDYTETTTVSSRKVALVWNLITLPKVMKPFSNTT